MKESVIESFIKNSSSCWSYSTPVIEQMKTSSNPIIRSICCARAGNTIQILQCLLTNLLRVTVIYKPPQNLLLIRDVIWRFICVCVDVIWLANLSQMEGSAHVWRSDLTVSMETSPSKPSTAMYCSVASPGDLHLHHVCVCVFVHADVYLHDCACVYSLRAFVWRFQLSLCIMLLCIYKGIKIHFQIISYL